MPASREFRWQNTVAAVWKSICKSLILLAERNQAIGLRRHSALQVLVICDHIAANLHELFVTEVRLAVIGKLRANIEVWFTQAIIDMIYGW